MALEVNDDHHSIFHVAVLHRHVRIFEILFEKDHTRDRIITLEDKNGNNILHLIGEYAKVIGQPNISRMGKETELELQWFKIVESILPDYLCKKKNATGLTPYKLFFKNHEDLFSKEEKLMKETVSQLMVVPALVATISFATIFTFPGGYHEDNGIPIFLRKTLSKLFIISNSLAFLFSTTSILMVIYILIFAPNRYDRFKISSFERVQGSMRLVFLSIITIIVIKAILNG